MMDNQEPIWDEPGEENRPSQEISMTVKGKILFPSEQRQIKAEILMDTGAKLNVIGKRFAYNNGMQDLITMYKNAEGPIVRLGGTDKVIVAEGYINLTLVLEENDLYLEQHKRTVRVRFEVLNTQKDMIVGIDGLLSHIPQYLIKTLQKFAELKVSTEPENYFGQFSDMSEISENTAKTNLKSICNMEKWMHTLADDISPEVYTLPQEDVTNGKLYYPWSDKQEVAPEEQILTDTYNVWDLNGLDFLQDEEARLLHYKNTLPSTFGPEISNNKRQLEKWEKMLLSKEVQPVFVTSEWTGLKIDPIHIDTLESMPKRHTMPSRHINAEMQEKIKEMIYYYIKLGLYIMRTSATVSGLVAVRKPNGSPRICSDFRWLNTHLKAYNSFIPNVRTEMEKMKEFTYFNELDWYKAFRQIPIDEQSKELLAMVTPWGVVQPNYLPEGVGPASAIMQDIVTKIFAPVFAFSVCIADNIIIGGHDLDDLYNKTSKVLELARQYNVILSIDKSNFGVRCVKFFGYQIKENCYTIDDNKRTAVKDLIMPMNQKQMKSFLGFANFFSPFIEGYAHKAALLHNMTRKEYNWKDIEDIKRHKIAFDQMKTAMANATDIFFPDRTFIWILRTDASEYAVGGTLLQVIPGHIAREKGIVPKEGEDVVYQPIWFGSQKLSEAARRWSTIEQETYAIVYCVKSLHYYLALRPFILETDHANILYLEKSDVPKLIRWRLYLQDHQFLLRHIPGKLNTSADYLSRPIDLATLEQAYDNECSLEYLCMEISSDHNSEEISEHFGKSEISNMLESEEGEVPSLVPLHHHKQVNLDAITYSDSEEEEEGLPALNESISDVPKFISDTPKISSDAPKINSDSSNKLTTKNILNTEEPEKVQLTQIQMFQKVHNGRVGHSGVQRTYKDLKARFPTAIFPIRTVRELVEECPICQKGRLADRNKLQEVRKHLHVTHFRGTISIDTLTLVKDKEGYKYLMVFINQSTKRVILKASKERDARATREAILYFIKNIGLHDCWWSDPGSEFDNKLAKELSEILGIDIKFTMVNRPQANGVERSNGKILRYVKDLIMEEEIQNDWSDLKILTPLQFWLNNRVNGETGYSANELTFGIESERYGAIPSIPYAGNDKWVQEFTRYLEILRARAAGHLKTRQEDRIKDHEDKGIRFAIDDLVFVRNNDPLLQHKFKERNEGPYLVTNHRDNDVSIRSLISDKVTTVHMNRCRIFDGSKEAAQQVARSEANEFQIHKINRHTGNPLYSRTLLFQVLWSDESTTEETLEIVKDTQALQIYAQQHAFYKIWTMNIGDFNLWRIAANKNEVKSWKLNCPQDTFIPLIREDFYISIFYFNKGNTLETEALTDFAIQDRVFQATVTKAKPTSKSIDIHIPDLDYKRVKCIKELTLSDVCLYVRPTISRADKSILVNKRDMLKTNLKSIRLWEDLYGETYIPQ